ncbi:MAG TPA: hypothetical protein VIT92_11900 [Burkholderiaceae bacterium]
MPTDGKPSALAVWLSNIIGMLSLAQRAIAWREAQKAMLGAEPGEEKERLKGVYNQASRDLAEAVDNSQRKYSKNPPQPGHP